MKSVDETKFEKTYGYEITTNVVSLDILIGKVFTHIELLGLTDRQLSALKRTMRGMFWEWYNNHLDNPSGYADPSHMARVDAGIEPLTSGTGGPVYVNYSATNDGSTR